MNALKRSLALLLIVAMMISSFAFAEGEEILMISQEPEAIQEEISEESEAADDEALEMADLFAEFPVQEELTIVEDTAVEEVPAEEESEEISMEELAESLGGMNCAHTDSHEYSYSGWNNGTDNGDGTHYVERFDEEGVQCSDCGEYLWSVESNNRVIASEAHKWNTYESYYGGIKSSCEICYAENLCTHEFVKTEGDRYSQGADDNGDGTHTLSYYACYNNTCTKCGAYYPIGGYDMDNLITVTEEHEFRDGDGYCYWCYAEPYCEHANFNKYGDNKWVKEVISSNADTCSFVYDSVIYGDCFDCNRYVEIVVEENLTANKLPHEWGSIYDESGNVSFKCMNCETPSTCSHSWILDYEGRYDYEGRAKDNGNGTHDITFRSDRGYRCSKCGVDYWENDEEFTTIKGEEHEYWGLECRYCGAANPCEHKNAIEDGGNDYANPIVHSTDKFNHTITSYTRTWYYCPDCGSEYDVTSSEPTIVNQTLPHEYDNGRCWICDYVNTCTHPDFEYQYEGYQPDWQDLNWLISTNLTTHTYWAKEYREGMCPDCREYLYDYGTESVQHTEAHHYYDNEKECNLCGYVPNCKHKNIVTSKEIYTHYNSGNVTKYNDQLHSVKRNKVTIETCVDCGYSNETTTGTYTVLEPHSYYLSDTCDCGYKNTCKHKNTFTDTWENWNGAAVSVDKKSHKNTVYKVTAVICEDCGEVISEKTTGTLYETDNHTFGAANICTACGYVTTCTHSSTSKNSDSHSYYEIVSLDKHQKVTYNYTTITCKSCNAYLYQRSSVTTTIGSASAHTFEDGYCTACGLVEQGAGCKHSWKNGVCTKCEEACTHSYADCVCVICGLENHVWEGCECTGCDLDKHVWNGCICAVCGQDKHAWEDCVCTACGEDKHIWNGCVCTACGKDTHNWVDFTCTICGMVITTAQKVSVQGLDENNTLSVGINMPYQIVLNVEPAGAEFEAVYTTSNKKNVTVSADGVITGVAAGKSATITVSPADAASVVAPVSFTVNVVAPTKVVLSTAKATLGVGESFTLTAAVDPADAPVVYAGSSSNDKVATVVEVEDGIYLVEGVKAGTAKITVQTQNGKKATCTVTVKAAPTAVTLNAEAVELAAGETTTLIAELDSAKAVSAITWTSSNEAVATVVDGVVTAVSAGEATITASTFNGLTAHCLLKVWNAPASIVVAESKLMSVGQKFTPEITLLDANGEATIGSYTVETSNKTYATVSGNTITAKKATMADAPVVITVKISDTVKAECAVTVLAAPTKVIVSPAKVSLGVGETTVMSVSHEKADAPTEYTVSSSNAKVATVEEIESGRYIITAGTKTGSAKITVATHNGKKATCTVTVQAAPEGVKLDKTAADLAVGETVKLTAALEGKKTASGITWTSSNEAVATVAGGVITTVGVGEATITAATFNGHTAVCTVKVWPAPARIEVTDAVILSVKQTYTPEIVLLDAEGNPTIGTVTVEGNKTYAPVSSNVITAKKATKENEPAIITFTAYNGLTATCAVTVMAAPKSVKIAPTKVTMGEGESIELAVSHLNADAPTTYEISSNKPAVADVEVNENGAYILKAYAAGSATITVKTHNGKKATCKVTVQAAPTGITLTETADVVCKETAKLTAKLEGKKAYSAITWTSSDESIVTVENGVITGVAQGEAIITASTYNGHSAQCKVKVWMPAQSVHVVQNNVTISVGQAITPEVELKDEFSNVTIGEYTLKTTNKGLVTVNGNTITGKKATKADHPVEVQVILDGEVKNSIWVTVVAAPKEVTLAEESMTIGAGSQKQIQVNASAPANYTYSSSNGKVAGVDANGLVTAVAPGTAVITVKSHNGKKATCKVTVTEAVVPSVDLASTMGGDLSPVWTGAAE